MDAEGYRQLSLSRYLEQPGGLTSSIKYRDGKLLKGSQLSSYKEVLTSFLHSYKLLVITRNIKYFLEFT